MVKNFDPNITWPAFDDSSAAPAAPGPNVNMPAVNGIGDAKPVFFSGPETVHLTEAQDLSTGSLMASGDLFFKDTARPTSLSLSTTVSASLSDGRTVPLSNAALLAALTTSLKGNPGDVRGEIDWNFSLPNSAVNFLLAGETLTLTYDISVTDPNHGTATQAVTVTVLGVNHPPVFTSGPESASVAELANTTGSATLDTTPTGTLTFTDQGISSTHTVSTSVAFETWSGGSNIPAATLTDLANALATTLNDSTGTGSGSVDWTFSIPDKDLDFLGQGETLTAVYEVEVSNGGASADQLVTITAVGANDPVTITSGAESGTVAELASTTGSSTADTSAPGTLSFTDVDLSDIHAVTVTLDSAVWSVNPDVLPFQTLVDLESALATTLNDSTGTGSGSVNWSFSIPDLDLDFLSAGETLTATYDITVSDAAGSSSTQNVVITMTGAEDPLVVNPVTNQVSDTAFTDTGSVLGGGDLFINGTVSAGDLATTLSVTAVNGQAANVDSLVAGTYGDLFVDAGGFYEYIANSSVDPLQVGDNVTDQFNFTVTDSLGRSKTETLTFNISGADDAPVITSADAVGSMTKDAGPSALVNGGFETGDLTGWSASSPAISAGFFGLGGAFGNYLAVLGAGSASLSQDVVTTPGQQYTLSFVVDGDPEASVSPLTVTWDGATILSLDQVPLGFTQYTFNVTGDAFGGTTPLSFSYSDDGNGILLDQVAVNALTNPATESAQGAINFSDAETGDTHVASFQPNSAGYVGTFSLDPVSEVPGAGSVEWHFSVDNSAIQFLSQGQTLTQDYLVTITDENGASVTQDVTIVINGADGPGVVAVNPFMVHDPGPSSLTVSQPGPSSFMASDPGPSSFKASDPGPSSFMASDPGPSSFMASDPGPSSFMASDPGPSSFMVSDPGPSSFMTSDPGPSSFMTSDPGPSLFMTSDPGPSLFKTSDPGPSSILAHSDGWLTQAMQAPASNAAGWLTGAMQASGAAGIDSDPIAGTMSVTALATTNPLQTHAA